MKINRKIKYKNIPTKKILCLIGVVFFSNGKAIYTLPENITYPPGENTKRVGAIIGHKPYIKYMRASGPITARAGDEFSLNYNHTYYQFEDVDEDYDISYGNFSWFCFKKPEELFENLAINYPSDPYSLIRDLVSSGEAIEYPLGNTELAVVEQNETASKLELKKNCIGQVGFIITPETSNGLPIGTRINKTIIVPSTSISVQQNEDGTLYYDGEVPPIEIEKTIFLDIDSIKSNGIPVPPRDFKGRENIFDNDVLLWGSVSFTLYAEDTQNLGSKIDLSDKIIDWIINLNIDGENLSFNINDSNKMNKYGVKASQPIYDSVNKYWKLIIASNKPLKGSLYVNFINDLVVNDGEINFKEFRFYEKPSESIEMNLYDIGRDGLGIPKIVNQNDNILPDRIYELEILDTENKVRTNNGEQPTNVTHFFSDYIKWGYADELNRISGLIHISGCDGTYRFPTQIDNKTRVAREILNLAPSILTNYEQGLRLVPKLDIPIDILNGVVELNPVNKNEMLTCENK